MHIPPPNFFKKKGVDCGKRPANSGEKVRTNLRIKGQKNEKSKRKNSSKMSTRKGSISASKLSVGKGNLNNNFGQN